MKQQYKNIIKNAHISCSILINRNFKKVGFIPILQFLKIFFNALPLHHHCRPFPIHHVLIPHPLPSASNSCPQLT